MPRPSGSLNFLNLSKPLKITFWATISLGFIALEHGPVLGKGASQNHCKQSLPELIPPLMDALPSYTNRVTQRSRSGNIPLQTYVLIAGNADFDPLPLVQQQWRSVVPDTTKQIFFTTMERSYTDQRAIATQNFYWAFFVETDQGWQLALLYQQLGGFSKNQPTSPRRDASNGAIAQGIKLWLRDCQAGVFSIPSQQSQNQLLVK